MCSADLNTRKCFYQTHDHEAISRQYKLVNQFVHKETLSHLQKNSMTVSCRQAKTSSVRFHNPVLTMDISQPSPLGSK